MASKKYTLLSSLLIAAASTGFAQMAGTVDYKDSSKVPASRLAQQNEWRNNSKTQTFPARPRDMWQLGVFGGLFFIDGDAYPNPGWNVGLSLRKALGYVVSVRGALGYGQTSGMDYRKNGNIGNNPALAAYSTTPGYYVHNYKNTTINPAVDLLVSLNNIMFHKKSSKFNLYGLVGYSPIVYRTKMDVLNGSSAYNYGSLPTDLFIQKRKDIRKELRDFFDGEYETWAKVNDRKPNFNNGDADAWQIRHSVNTGVGLEYKIGQRASLSAELKYVLTFDDYIDGWYLQNGSQILTPNEDNLVYTNIGFNYNLGSSAKRVAPLWQLNPLGYTYGELSNPSIMKFPKPVLDDTDGDGVTDQFDIEPNTPAGCPVDTKGKSRDTDGDGVPDCRDKELVTPSTCQPVDADGVGKCPDPECCKNMVAPVSACNIGSLPSVEFGGGSVKVSKDAASILDAAAAQIKANPNCKVAVVGHGGASKREQQLSWDRVNSVINYLVEKQGVSRDRFVFKYGEEGDANTVDLQDATGSEGPNTVPAPHPQYRKN